MSEPWWKQRGGIGLRRPLALAFGVLAASGIAHVSAAPACSARSESVAATVVELYTSEGCNSCPPADRWLSALKGRPDVIGLAFHVDYWDRLGWKDRFASAAYTQRQLEQQRVNGARFAYTPQVVVDGQDRKDWPRLAIAGPRSPATVSIELSRERDRVSARVTLLGEPSRRLAGYWALTEFGHRSAVKAGENEGATLEHDFVVRDYRPVAAWTGAAGAAQTMSWAPAAGDVRAAARSITLVVTDASTGRPLQALALPC